MAARRSLISLAKGAIGWSALAATLLAALPRGANIPVAWLALSLVVFALFALQLVVDAIDLADARAQQRLGRLVLPGLLAVGALAWGLTQTSSAATAALGAALSAAAGLFGGAPDLVHPAWATVEAPGAISADPIDGRQAAIRIALTLALFWIAVRAGGSARRAGLMLRAIAVAVAALAVFGLFAAARGNAILGEAAGGPVSASFVNRNSFATYAAFGLLASLAVLLSAGPGNAPHVLRKSLERFFAGGWLFLGAFAVSATALIASSSRGGAIAATAGLATIVLISRRGGRRPGPVALVVLAATVFVLAISAGGLVGRFSSGAAGMRGPVYAAIVEGLADRPLLGHGLGAFQDAFRAYLPREAGAGGEWDLAHNSYLELAFELGLPAALAFLLALALVCLQVVRGALARPGAAVPLAGAGCAVAAAVHSAFDFSLQIPAVGALFAMILGLAFAQSSPRS